MLDLKKDNIYQIGNAELFACQLFYLPCEEVGDGRCGLVVDFGGRLTRDDSITVKGENLRLSFVNTKTGESRLGVVVVDGRATIPPVMESNRVIIGSAPIKEGGPENSFCITFSLRKPVTLRMTVNFTSMTCEEVDE